MPEIRLDRGAAQRILNYLLRQQAEQAELGALIESLVQAPTIEAAAPPEEKKPDAGR